MKEQRLEFLLTTIRSLIALSVGVVVAMLSLGLAIWLQSEWIDPAHDFAASISGFLAAMTLGGFATGLALRASSIWRALAHGLGFIAVFLLMFVPAWIQNEAISTGLITGLVSAGLALGGLAAMLGNTLRRHLPRRKS